MIRKEIKPLPAEYRGITYRSRTEARWAVFFQTLGIKFDYEREGYDLDGLWYLPDFWLPELQVWVEIKPDEPTGDECEKAHRLAVCTGFDTFVFFGGFRDPVDDYDPPRAYATFADGVEDEPYFFCECSSCGLIGITFDGRSDRLKCKEPILATKGFEKRGSGCPRSAHGDKGYNHRSENLSHAYKAARCVRFGR